MDDATLAALCIWDEAAGEQYEGKVAVGRVIRNRMAAHYESDGTVSGTVLAPGQFSGFWYSMLAGKYTRDAWTLAQAAEKAATMLGEAQRQVIFTACQKAWQDAAPGSGFVGGPQFEKLTPQTVLYLNPAILTHLPPWADPAKQVAVIYNHTFYHA